MLSLLALFLFPMTFSFWNHLKSKGPYPTVREKALMSWEFAHNNTPWGLVFLLGMVVMECFKDQTFVCYFLQVVALP